MNNKLKEIAVRLQQILDQITLLQNEYQSLYQEKKNLYHLKKKIRIIYRQKKSFYYFLKGLLDELIPLLMQLGR